MLYQFFKSEKISLELGTMIELCQISSQLDGGSVIILIVELNSYEVVMGRFSCHIVNLYF